MDATAAPLPVDRYISEEIFGGIPAPYVADALCVRRATLAAWRRRGVGPPSMMIGHLLTVYPTRPLLQWLASPAASRTRRRLQRVGERGRG